MAKPRRWFKKQTLNENKTKEKYKANRSHKNTTFTTLTISIPK